MLLSKLKMKSNRNDNDLAGLHNFIKEVLRILFQTNFKRNNDEKPAAFGAIKYLFDFFVNVYSYINNPLKCTGP